MRWRWARTVDVEGVPVVLGLGGYHPEDQRVEAGSKVRLASAPMDWNSAASGAAASLAGKLHAAGSLLHKKERRKVSGCARTRGGSREVRGGEMVSAATGNRRRRWRNRGAPARNRTASGHGLSWEFEGKEGGDHGVFVGVKMESNQAFNRQHQWADSPAGVASYGRAIWGEGRRRMTSQ